jgi:hypothetical protein
MQFDESSKNLANCLMYLLLLRMWLFINAYVSQPAMKWDRSMLLLSHKFS